VCCSVLQCLQCVVVSCSVLPCIAVCDSVMRCGAVCYSVLQCVAVCCSVLQRGCEIYYARDCVVWRGSTREGAGEREKARTQETGRV